MGIQATASNASAVVGKWVPYYHKPFQLGRIADGLNSTDGGIYITKTAGSGSGLTNGVCFSSHNCGHYYEVEIEHTVSDKFLVYKYDLEDRLIDTIIAGGTSGSPYYWDTTNLTESFKLTITIDIGVAIHWASTTLGTDGDRYRINLPTFDQMEKRKIYHGGWATFLKMPHDVSTAYHSEIVPQILQDKSVVMSFNPPIYKAEGVNGSTGALSACNSTENISGNQGISVAFAWNVNPSGIHGTASSSGSFGWAANETWGYGTALINDSNPGGTYGVDADFPVHVAAAGSDTSGISTTGTSQTANATMSGRAGHLKIRTEFLPAAGGEAVLAENQYWPCILTIY